MDKTGAFQRCRLAPFDGGAAAQDVGPAGRCVAAAWSPDGRWMYFNVQTDAGAHLWRQRPGQSAPEQMTVGPTEEEGLAVMPDGKSLITGVGTQHSAIWIHDPAGDRALTSEDNTFAPRFSRDGTRVYYLAQPTSSFLGARAESELWVREIASGKAERLVPDRRIEGFDISADETEVAFSLRAAGGQSQVWLASLDRRSAPRRVVADADQVSFGAADDLIVRALGPQLNSLERVRKDGSRRERIGSHVILGKFRTSPDGEWVLANVVLGADGGSAQTVAIATRSGVSVPICARDCQSAWSSDGRWFRVTHGVNQTDEAGISDSPRSRTLLIPVPAGRSLPDLPAGGLPFDLQWTGPGSHAF